MPTLLTIPRELRDEIFRHGICSRKNEPPHLDKSFDDFLVARESFDNPKLRAWSHPQLVYYCPDEYATSAKPSMLVCKQLYTEIKENLRIWPGARSYELDIVVLHEVVLCPTWLMVPTLTTLVDSVDVTFRIAGCFNRKDPKYKRFGTYKGFRGGDGAGPAMSWQIYSILERFFKVGPTGMYEGIVKNRKVCIKKLTINITTPEGVDVSRFVYPRNNSSREQDLKDCHLNPQFLTHFIDSDVKYMLGMTYHSADYGRLFYEHMDEVHVLRDNEEVGSYDVASHFKDLEFGDAFNRREDHFLKWKQDTEQERKDQGLKVLAE